MTDDAAPSRWHFRTRQPRSLGVERALALALTALIGTRLSVQYHALVGVAVALAVIPVWIVVAKRYQLITTLWALLGAAIVSGALLTQILATSHPTILYGVVERSVLLVNLIVATGTFLWARSLSSPGTVAIAFGVGYVAGIALNPVSDVNAWRFSFSLPIAILALAITAYVGRLWLDLTVVAALVVIGSLNDSRSNSAMLALAAIVVGWDRLRRRIAPGRRRAGQLLSMACLAIVVFLVAQAVILEGGFGEATRARTEAQIATSGSVLLGGRPEIAASAALIARYPWGMGSGTITTGDDINAAKSAMWSIGYDPNNGYVEKFLFGSTVEVHSLLGDMWLWFGIPGLLAAAAIVVVVVRGLDRQLRNGTVTVLAVYLTARFFWDLAFSPAVSALPLLALTIALLAIPTVTRGDGMLERAETRAGLRRGMRAGAGARASARQDQP